jgi:drug/metabolite transporter (DMT)-like permease
MTDRKHQLDGLAVASLIGCCAFWGLQQILIKTTVPEVPSLWQATLRFWGAFGLLWLWCVLRRIPLFERDGTLGAGLLAGLLFAGEFACIYLGLRDTTASRLTVFLYTAPFVVALFLPAIVPGEKLRLLQWVGLAVAFGGVALAFGEGFTGGQAGPNQLRGDLLGLLAGAFWGLTTLVIRGSKLGTASAEKMLFYQVGVTVLVAPLLSLALGERWDLSYSAYAWTSIGVQAAIGAFASYLLWMWMLRHYPATLMSSFTFLAPVFALVFGVVLLGEPLSVQLVAALAGVAAGIVLVNRKAAPAH